jgi:phage-related protein
MPAHSKALGSGLFELKVDTKGRALRFFYMHWKGRIVILGCLDKKTQKIPDQVMTKMRERKRRIEEGEESLEQLAVH